MNFNITPRNEGSLLRQRVYTGSLRRDMSLVNLYGEDSEFHVKYEPREILGKGLSSTVRRCVSRDTGQEFAVKIIDKSQDAAVEESIMAEVDILGHLPPHPNIIRLQDMFHSPSYVFLVFELASGGELFDYLTKMVRLSEKKTRQIMQQLLLAVEHIHSFNVIHRDLKPENILLDKNMVLKLSDFGFAVEADSDEELSDLLGTPGYLAPEMLQKSVEAESPGYNREVDMWACGVIMYTLLAGFPPFWHRKQLVMLRNIMNGRYEFVSPEWDDISDKAKDMIRKLLVVDHKDRLTATQALEHPFLQIQPVDFYMFSARRRLKASLLCVRACVTIQRLYRSPKTVTLEQLGPRPYENRHIRKRIDTCAFHIYAPWVKRGEVQNRAALFETRPKTFAKVSVNRLSSLGLTSTISPPPSIVIA